MECRMPASLSFTLSGNLLKLMFVEWVMPPDHCIVFCPLLLRPSIFPSIRVFCNELALHIRWPKYRSFSFSISPSNEYSGLTAFKTDQFDHLAVQGTLESPPAPQFDSLKFFIDSSVLCLLYGPALISVHAYWKDHSQNYRDTSINWVFKI